MKMIDLSMTIRPHWRWPVETKLRHDFGESDFRSSMAQLPAHAYTHVDTTLHCRRDGTPLEKLPVDAYSGSAAVIDLSGVIRPNEGISAGVLEERGGHVRPHDIIILKTCWDTHYSPYSEDYWREAPFVTDEAALWLKSKDPRVVAFDFPQDYAIKDVTRKTPVTLDESTTHKHLLFDGVLFVEYMMNLGQVTSPRITLIALPLKIEGFEGCPARVVAIEEEP
ncbi:MAG: cyclase family protein [Acetobacteraceae bacterium]|nr:cyclase family protein [Acetobacteraceae bacterium]